MVINVRPVTQRLLVQALLWSLNGVCFVLRQGTLSMLSKSIQVNWVLAFAETLPAMDSDGLVSNPGGVNDSHLLSTRETRVSSGLMTG